MILSFRLKIFLALALSVMPLVFVQAAPSDDFVTTWDSSLGGTNTEVELPAFGAASNFQVDWDNDGTFDETVVGDVLTSHDYGVPGIYTIRISGVHPEIKMLSLSSPERRKLVDVNQWGTQTWTSLDSAFSFAVNMNMSATDAPDLSGVTSLSDMFLGANAFNGNINHWDVSGISDFSGMFVFTINYDQPLNNWDMRNAINLNSMFSGAFVFNQDISNWQLPLVTSTRSMFSTAIAFNQNIGNWDIQDVTDMTDMFNSAGLSTVNYDATLTGWEAQAVQNGVPLGASGLTYCDASGARSRLITNSTWAFSGDSLAADCVPPSVPTGLNSPASTTVSVDLSWTASTDNIGIANYVVYRDGVEVGTPAGTTFTDTGLTLNTTYAYTVQAVDTNGNRSAQSSSIDVTTNGLDPTDFVTTWDTTLTGGLSDSNNTSIRLPRFGAASNFDVDWDNDGVFDQTVVGNVTTTHDYGTPGIYTIRMRGSFSDLSMGAGGGGDSVKIIDVNQWGNQVWSDLFGAFTFCLNVNVSATDAPDLSGVTSLSSMFSSAGNFNANINHWDVSGISNFGAMFFFSTIFDQPLDSWDMRNAVDLRFMFGVSSFDQDLSGWELPLAQDLEGMFSASPFNQDISSWNLPSADDLSNMFNGASSFNQNISSWNLPSAINMSRMFDGATSFNQSLGNWDIADVTDMSNMLRNSALSTVNYDNTLLGWQAGPKQLGVPLGATGLNYCNSAAARADLEGISGWTITGDTNDCTNANNNPTNLLVDGANLDTVSEKSPIGSTIGTLTALDPDGADTHTFALTCAVPGPDDGFFQVGGVGQDTLQTAGVLNFNSPVDANGDNAYQICVQANDGNFGTFDKNLTITVRANTSAAEVTVRSVKTSPSGSRFAGQTRDEFKTSNQFSGRVTKHNFSEAYAHSVEEVAKINDGQPAQIVKYEKNGQQKFLGYINGRLSMAQTVAGQEFNLIWRPVPQKQTAQIIAEVAGEDFLASAPDEKALEKHWSEFYQRVIPGVSQPQWVKNANPERTKPMNRASDLETWINRKKKEKALSTFQD